MILSNFFLLIENTKDLFTSLKKNYKKQDDENFQTYWQFLLKVENTENTRKILFLNQIEPGITNLPELSKICNEPQNNSGILLSRYIFLPLHKGISSRKYNQILSIIKNKN